MISRSLLSTLETRALSEKIKRIDESIEMDFYITKCAFQTFIFIVASYVVTRNFSCATFMSPMCSPMRKNYSASPPPHPHRRLATTVSPPIVNVAAIKRLHARYINADIGFGIRNRARRRLISATGNTGYSRILYSGYARVYRDFSGRSYSIKYS